MFEEPHQIVPFDNVGIDEDGHYNATTGRYTAPASGIYQFIWYIRATQQANSWLYIDGYMYVNTLENYKEGVHGDGASVLVSLQAGQVVDVRTGGEPYTVIGDSFTRTWFGGYLLFPEI